MLSAISIKAQPMSKKPKNRDWDDGSTIADMNVEGMPWNSKRKTRAPRTPQLPKTGPAEPPLTRKETWGLVINALGAALLIGLVFVVVVFLFILFCIYVWFK